MSASATSRHMLHISSKPMVKVMPIIPQADEEIWHDFP